VLGDRNFQAESSRSSASDSKRPTTKLAAIMSWNDELVATGTTKTLTAGDIRSRWAAVHQVLGCPALKTSVDGHSKLILDTFRNVQPVQLREM